MNDIIKYALRIRDERARGTLYRECDGVEFRAPIKHTDIDELGLRPGERHRARVKP